MNKNILVAKSYQDLEIISAPFSINGREYVKVRLKNGETKTVRSYTKTEYMKYNPEVKVIQKAKSKKDVLGFGEKGFIWIFKGDTYAALDWFRQAPTKYNDIFGWYLSSDIEMPSPLPVGIEPIKLTWEMVQDLDDKDNLMEKDLIKKVVESLIYDEGTSEWLGIIGDKVTVNVTCLKIIPFSSAYGISTLYTFITDDGNNCTWMTTTSPGLQEEGQYNITGKIKGIDIYRNQKTTALTRVKVNHVIESWD